MNQSKRQVTLVQTFERGRHTSRHIDLVQTFKRVLDALPEEARPVSYTFRADDEFLAHVHVDGNWIADNYPYSMRRWPDEPDKANVYAIAKLKNIDDGFIKLHGWIQLYAWNVSHPIMGDFTFDVRNDSYEFIAELESHISENINNWLEGDHRDEWEGTTHYLLKVIDPEGGIHSIGIYEGNHQMGSHFDIGVVAGGTPEMIEEWGYADNDDD
jgi:hypothetical protein